MAINEPAINPVKFDIDDQERQLDLGTIVFLGDGNFTFSTALAAYRGSGWCGIVPTELMVTEQMRYRYPPYGICLSTIHDNDTEKKAALKALASEDGTPIPRTLDATNMGTRTQLLGQIFPETQGAVQADRKLTLWFQCPWPKDFDDEKVAIFLHQFVESSARVQLHGEYLIIGILLKIKYFTRYCLPQHEDQHHPLSMYYCLEGVDSKFGLKIHKNGYKWTPTVKTSAMAMDYGTDMEMRLYRRSSTGYLVSNFRKEFKSVTMIGRVNKGNILFLESDPNFPFSLAFADYCKERNDDVETRGTRHGIVQIHPNVEPTWNSWPIKMQIPLDLGNTTRDQVFAGIRQVENQPFYPNLTIWLQCRLHHFHGIVTFVRNAAKIQCPGEFLLITISDDEDCQQSNNNAMQAATEWYQHVGTDSSFVNQVNGFPYKDENMSILIFRRNQTE